MRPAPYHPAKPRRRTPWRTLATVLLGCALPHAAYAGDRLVGTWGVTQAEGAAGGGLTPWALIAGSGSRDQTAATAYATRWRSQGGYQLHAAGAAVGIHDTIELSLARWRFGLSDTVPGQSIDMDIVGAKWRVWGDALHDQDRWWPQVALGFQHKRNRSMAVPTALGARRASDTEPYASATKLWLGGLAGHNVLGNLTLRATRANQFGLLGFGGDLGERRRLHPEASLAVLLRDDLALGAEWRSKPSNLGVFGEQSAHDVFLAWFPTRHLSATLSYLNLGDIAGKTSQRGWYVSLQGAL